MSNNSDLKIASGENPSNQALAALFDRFVNTSAQLEHSYHSLKVETEELRIRLKAKDEEIAQKTRLATLGQAAAALAHEIRNPLGAIKLFSSLLKSELENRPEGLKFLSHIEQSISQLDATISNILQFTKQAPIKCSPINLTALIKERISSFELSHPGLSIDAALQEDHFVNGVEQSLRQIVNNLLTNAAQATKEKGNIKICLNKTNSDQIILKISDSGPGIPESIVAELFEPFITTKNEGVGLGLAIVKRLVEQQGATICASNQQGAVFTITFPVLGASNNKLAA